MTKQAWIKHIEETEHISADGISINEFKGYIFTHKIQNPDCPECKARRKTRRANNNRKIRDDVMKSCGLTKVYGAVSGKVYWE